MRDQDLSEFAQGEMGKASKYVDISNIAGDATGKIPQNPKGGRNGFDLASPRLSGQRASRCIRPTAIILVISTLRTYK